MDLALVLIVRQLQLRRSRQVFEVAVVKDDGLVVPDAEVAQDVQMFDTKGRAWRICHGPARLANARWSDYQQRCVGVRNQRQDVLHRAIVILIQVVNGRVLQSSQAHGDVLLDALLMADAQPLLLVSLGSGDDVLPATGPAWHWSEVEAFFLAAVVEGTLDAAAGLDVWMMAFEVEDPFVFGLQPSIELDDGVTVGLSVLVMLQCDTAPDDSFDVVEEFDEFLGIGIALRIGEECMLAVEFERHQWLASKIPLASLPSLPAI